VVAEAVTEWVDHSQGRRSVCSVRPGEPPNERMRLTRPGWKGTSQLIRAVIL
jgi:hypothetical protein